MLVNQIIVPINYTELELKAKIAEKLNCKPEEILSFEIIKRSLDLRQKQPLFVISAEVLIASNIENNCDIKQDNKIIYANIFDKKLINSNFNKPVIIGAGPSGLMAGLILAKAGLSPILFERGAEIKERKIHVKNFWQNGILNNESNVLFGEGGAGLFSDGKLTTRIKDGIRTKFFLETLVECGAKKEILIESKPHLGSDVLEKIVFNLRNKIKNLGGQIYFNSCLDNLEIKNNKLNKISINNNFIDADICILATGHSSRDIYQLLYKYNASLEFKEFAIGIRLEIPQKIINANAWKTSLNNKEIEKFGAASFYLTHKSIDNLSRACYSFCMCPGGQVIACTSEPNFITTNGMSYSKRDGYFANAAFLVPVTREDFINQDNKNINSDNILNNSILAGCEFQKYIENKAFISAGSDYSLPACTLSDFLFEKTPKKLPKNLSCQRAKPVDFRDILPNFVMKTLRFALPKMLKKIKNAEINNILLYAPETRSSSPVRILRDANHESLNIKGLFPAGEGSGYSGGIVSSAVDGIKTAEAIIKLLQT